MSKKIFANYNGMNVDLEEVFNMISKLDDNLDSVFRRMEYSFRGDVNITSKIEEFKKLLVKKYPDKYEYKETISRSKYEKSKEEFERIEEEAEAKMRLYKLLFYICIVIVISIGGIISILNLGDTENKSVNQKSVVETIGNTDSDMEPL